MNIDLRKPKNPKSSIVNRKSNIPIQYQKGYVDWYKLKLKVTPDVLIPRPETELLVDAVLNYCNLYPETCNLILDIGTGSGNIAIALTKSLSFHPGGGKLNIIATDISEKALKVAKQNAKLHQVEKRITFLESNLLESPSILYTPYSILIIVTNLPYIPTSRIPDLDPSVKDFEPHIALDGGEDGFDLYRKLFSQIKEKGLKPKLIIGEIDDTQGNISCSEAKKYFPQAKVKVKRDLAHRQRILIIRSL